MTIQKKRCNRANYGGKRSSTKYIVVHYTSNYGDTAKNNADYFAREKVKASAHFFVDETEIWSSVPESGIAWHCGAKKYRHPKCRNANSIGVEICMNDKAGNIRMGSIEQAAQLVRKLMAQYSIPVECVIRHYDVTGKMCPTPMVQDDALWQVFHKKIEEESILRYQSYEEMPEWAKPTIAKLMKKRFLKGEGEGVLNLSEEALKLLVINDRAGCYGE